MSQVIVETLIASFSLSTWTTRWKRWTQRRWLAAMQRRNSEKLIRDTVARLEISAMRELIRAAEEHAARGAVLSTTRHAAKIGVSQDAVLVILQWLLMSRP